MKKPDHTSRSYHYQYQFHELSMDMRSGGTSQHWIDQLPGLYQTETKLSDEWHDLNQQLCQAIFALADRILTGKQLIIFNMLKSGMTQQEIADRLHVNQSNIVKTLHGNNNGGIFYGGIAHKIRKALPYDPHILLIMQKMAEIQEEEV